MVVTKVADFGVERFYCTLSILGKIEGPIVHNGTIIVLHSTGIELAGVNIQESDWTIRPAT